MCLSSSFHTKKAFLSGDETCTLFCRFGKYKIGSYSGDQTCTYIGVVSSVRIRLAAILLQINDVTMLNVR